MRELSKDRIKAAIPDLEERYGTVRNFLERDGVVFTGKRMFGEPAPFTLSDIQQLGMALRGLKLEDRTVIEPLYEKALLTVEPGYRQQEAWKIAAEERAKMYLAETDQANSPLQTRVQTAINTIWSNLGFYDETIHGALQFRNEKGTVIYEGRTISVQGVCPFTRLALDILGTAYAVMGVNIHLPSAERVLRDPRIMPPRTF